MTNYIIGSSRLVVDEDDNNVYSVDEENMILTIVPKEPIIFAMSDPVGYLTIPAGIIETAGFVYNKEEVITLQVNVQTGDTTTPEEDNTNTETTTPEDGTGSETTEPENGNESVETPGDEEVETGTIEGTGEETTTPEEENTTEEDGTETT